MHRMKVEEIAEAIAKLPPDQLARFRRWFTAFETGRADHAKEFDTAATKLGRLAGRAFAELKNGGTESVSAWVGLVTGTLELLALVAVILRT
jgi:hypothetical protein